MKQSCKLWIKTKPDAHGYPRVYFQGKLQRMSRVVFYQAHGYWPTVCRHTCDNRLCINSNHLIDGTIQDNVQDMVDRGRHAKGESNGNVVLTETIVLAIREDRAMGMSISALRRKYNVSYGCMYRVVNKQTWKHV